MAGILGAASIPFIACVVLLLAMILQILSFASHFWASNEKIDFGLWRDYKCVPMDPNNPVLGCRRWDQHWDASDWLHAVRGLESLTIIFWSLPLVILPVYIYVALGLYYRCILGSMTLLTLLGTICNIIGVVIYGIKIGEKDSWDPEWCIFVCAVAGVLGIIAFLVLLIATFKRPKFQPERHYVSGFYVYPDKNRMYVVESTEPPKSVYASEGQVNPALVED